MTWSYERLGYLYFLEEDYAAAEKAYAVRQQLTEQLYEEQPDYPVHVLGMAASCCTRMQVFERQGRFDEALAIAIEGLQYGEELVQIDSQNITYSNYYISGLSGAMRYYERTGNLEEAWKLVNRAIPAQARTLNADPGVIHHARRLASLYLSAARIQQQRGRVRHALTLLDELEALLSSYETSHPDDRSFANSRTQEQQLRAKVNQGLDQ